MASVIKLLRAKVMMLKQKKKKMQVKKAQVMGMSFQFIFSIILIIVFIFAAIIVIKVFLNRAEYARIISFEQELISEVNKLWAGPSASARNEFTFDLPSKIEYVCFSADLSKAESENFPKGVYEEISIYEDENADLFFYPPDVVEGHDMAPYLKVLCGTRKTPCLNLTGLAEQEKDPYCIRNKEGISITLAKEIGVIGIKILPQE